MPPAHHRYFRLIDAHEFGRRRLRQPLLPDDPLDLHCQSPSDEVFVGIWKAEVRKDVP